MRDYKLELRNLHASHTLGCTTKQTRKYLEMKMRSTSEKSTNAMGERTIQTRW